MKYLKELLGTAIAFGCEGTERDLDLFENLCYNYSISDKPHRLYRNFSFITTTPERLEQGLAEFLRNEMFFNKECKAYEFRILGIQKARKIINEAVKEPFYSNYLLIKTREDNISIDEFHYERYQIGNLNTTGSSFYEDS